MNFLELTHPDDREKDWELFSKAASGEQEYRNEKRYLKKDGNIVWVKVHVAFIRDEMNNPIRTVAICEDITELKGASVKLENSLKELKDYKFSIDQSAIIAFTDKKGVITDVNENFCSISGYKRHELIGQTHQLINANFHSFEFFNDLWKTISSGNVWRGEVKNKRKDGSFYWVYTTIVPFLDEKNKPFKYLAIRFDITLRKNAEEEIKFKANLLNTIEQAAIATDLEGIVNYWNKAAENIYGWSLEEALGQNIVQLTTPEPSKEQAMQIMKQLKIGKYWSGNFKVHKKDGTDFIALVSNSPVYDENNNLSGIIGVSTDISQEIKNEELLKQYNKELESSNERFEKVTEATNDVIWDWDLVQKTFYRSNAIESFFGNVASKLFNETDFWKDTFHPDDLDEVKNSIDKAVSDPLCNRWEAEYRIINYKGEILYVIDRGIILRDKDGKAIRMIGAMTNITDQKNNELLLQKLNKKLEKHTLELKRSNEELEQFAFITSHDLQEPLRMISSFMELLERKYKDELDEKAIQYIHFAIDGAKRMKQIILDLLLYSRANKPSEKIDEVDLNRILSEYYQLRSKLIEEKNGIINSIHLPSIKTYKAPLTQIFHGLLDNALKYSKINIPPKIEIITTENEFEWEFAIRDNGIGISQKYHEKIFVIFQRLHNRDSLSGSGIGLSIVKRSVEFLGGKIWLESKVGIGTTFYFTIPKKII
jgi:PAS domain S-box-containing protein